MSDPYFNLEGNQSADGPVFKPTDVHVTPCAAMDRVYVARLVDHVSKTLRKAANSVLGVTAEKIDSDYGEMLRHLHAYEKVIPGARVKVRDRIARSLSPAKRAQLGRHALARMEQHPEGSRLHRKWAKLAARCGVYIRALMQLQPPAAAEHIRVTFHMDPPSGLNRAEPTQETP